MRKKLLAGLVLLLLIAAGLFGWVGYRMFTTGFSAKTEPHPLEVWLARQVRHLAVPIAQRNASNPIPSNAEVLQEARSHFADHCAACHANDGSGKTPIGKGVYPQAPDLREPATQQMSDGELFWVIHNGIRFTGMPAWGEGEPEKDTDSWKLVHFIRHLPHLTPDELDEMKELNPKTKKEIEEEAAFDKFLEGDDSAATRSKSEHHH
ncbi:MAG TPA: c-type cytochrome [Nitrospira sp.]|nr:c-type cytochrome [Nitrospira sp.]